SCRSSGPRPGGGRGERVPGGSVAWRRGVRDERQRDGDGHCRPPLDDEGRHQGPLDLQVEGLRLGEGRGHPPGEDPGVHQEVVRPGRHPSADSGLEKQGVTMGKKRRGRNEGSIIYREDTGRWEGRISFIDGQGKRRRPTVTGDSKQEVLAKLDELKRKATGGVYHIEADKTRLADYLD